VSAVLGAYLVLLPTAGVLTVVFFMLTEIPAIFFLGIWFLLQLYAGGASILHPQAGGGVAFFAHVGGFAFGALLVRLVAIRAPLRARR
jgi:membrane associated rhomboid family serine protease